MADFGFYHPTDYLSQVCWVLEASNFTYWPKAGGLDDQDWHLIQDVITWFRLARRLRWELEQGIWRPVGEASPKNSMNPLDAPRAG